MLHLIICGHSVWWIGGSPWKAAGEWCDKGGKCQEGRVPPTCLDRWDIEVGGPQMGHSEVRGGKMRQLTENI